MTSARRSYTTMILLSLLVLALPMPSAADAIRPPAYPDEYTIRRVGELDYSMLQPNPFRLSELPEDVVSAFRDSVERDLRDILKFKRGMLLRQSASPAAADHRVPVIRAALTVGLDQQQDDKPCAVEVKFCGAVVVRTTLRLTGVAADGREVWSTDATAESAPVTWKEHYELVNPEREAISDNRSISIYFASRRLYPVLMLRVEDALTEARLAILDSRPAKDLVP